ncbi:hypothetical protein [Bradyrhizobium sp. HKCCYLS20291]|uniref:hypothetical protein n=1 Tax=Bradyrhizobium sp. HKCCYLS20291 TaxID=3420766 RepID=UPI003EC0E3E9
MPLAKSTLAQSLEQLFNSKPATAADAAAAWANAYLGYAGSALSSAASLPTNASANFPILLGGFQGGLSALAPAAAGALVAQGVSGFWQAIAWVGPTAAGTTAFPGNAALAAALSGIFADLGKSSPAEKANRLADAFDAGARTVIVADIPFVQPAPPIVGPIQ